MKDLTPERFRCGPIASSCPAVLATHDGKLAVIGKAVTEQDYPELAGRIGPDEQAIEISAELVREALISASADSAQVRHLSDCSVNNAPAYEPGLCDCGALK